MLGLSAAPDAGGQSGEPAPGASQQLWTCGMHPQVIQDHPGDCPICHMKLTPLKADAPAGGGSMAQTPSGSEPMPGMTGMQGTAKERKVKYWWDPMLSPPYIADKPGKSPMGMDLIPVYEDEVSATGGQVTIDPAVVQNMGVRIALVTEGPLAKTVRLVGYLDEAQPNIREVNLRVSGWIRRLYANTEGQRIEAGDPLFDLYSPELQVSIEELINGRRAKAALSTDADESAKQTAATLYDAAASKLELLGLERAQIDALAKLDKAPPTVTFVSPIAGTLTEKPVVEGAAVKMGDRVLKIVDYSTLWLDAQVFEKDLPFVKVGAKAAATIASGPTPANQPITPISGEIIFIHPRVDTMTRTALVRMAIPNPSFTLKPGMYATVHARAELADRAVMVPREAIIDTGDAQMAFVAQAVGKFEPRKVKMGLAGEDGVVQVVEGLSPGEAVVTSGQFLLDSESRLREAIQKYLNQKNQATTRAAPAPGGLAPAATPTLPMFDATPAQVEKVDAVVTAYLTISSALGAEQKDSPPPTPLDMTALIAAAHALHGAVSGTKIEPLAAGIAKAAEAMKGHPIDHQRSMFSALGEKVIALAEALPPSSAVAKTLFVMNCPMAPGGAKGDWLQTSPDVANPFFAADMKECGSQVRTIKTREVPR
ncbi:MAG: efflux RND transporter periplasmic adaptor subunit [Phycisphaerae bacterium]|nr:efflux RND transporter periplasmic adaptor subunit [Phycisphaerae bacterium]